MALVNNLKVQCDLPVWEWCRFAPTATTAVSSMTSEGVAGGRYLYYQVSNLLYRYDTITDSWHQLLSTTTHTTPTIMNNNVYFPYLGHYGRAISGGSQTIELAGLSGNVLVGYKIRIIDGTGRGQERTITAVSNPIVVERGVVTTGGTNSLVDASTGIGLKQWRVNQWRDYQVRIDFGGGKTQVRPILYNTINSIVWADVNHITVNPWAQPYLATTIPANSLYVIESHQVTVNADWNIVPDSTSKFVILSGGIINISQGTASAPFFSLLYYDILADIWFAKSTQTGIKTAVFTAGSDLSMEKMTEEGGALKTGTATSGGVRSLFDIGANMTPMEYANFQLRIVSGTGMGQVRTILSNTATRFNLTKDWEVSPNSTSVYEVWRDCDKVWIIGGGDAGLLQYSIESDQVTTGKQFDDGQCNQLAARRNGEEPFALTSITRTTGGISVLDPTPSAAGSGYNVDDILTITTGGSGGTARVLTVNATGGVLSVALETSGSGYTTGAGKATTVVPTGGSGCTLNIITIADMANCTTPIAHTFRIGDTVTISGANQADYNGVKTIIGTASTTTFTYVVTGSPSTPATFTAPSTTQLVDCTKNWVVNEHAGKLVQLATNAVFSTGQVRRIVSNTATTLVWTLAATAPVNGTTRYVIEDIKPFGTEMTLGGRRGNGTEGFATGGSTTTLVDTTKNWQTNYWSRTVGRVVRIVEGTGVGSEMPILSNTNNTLTYLAQSFVPDTTTRYEIQDCYGMVSGAGGISTIAQAPTAGGSGYALGDVSNVTGGTARVRVIGVSGGVVTAIQLVSGGTSGYVVGTGTATTNVTGTGTGLTVNITAITAAGSTTVLQDNTKNWDTNAFVGKRVRFLSGTGQGNEYTITANTFNTLTYATGTAPDVSTAYAILEAPFKTNGVRLDAIVNSTNTAINNKYMYSWTGTATPELTRYNITNEHWELLSYFPQFETLTTGSMYAYDRRDRIYFTKDSTGRIFYYDLVKNIVVPASTIPYGMSTAISGNRMEVVETVDGLKYLYIMRHSGQEMWRTLLFF